MSDDRINTGELLIRVLEKTEGNNQELKGIKEILILYKVDVDKLSIEVNKVRDDNTKLKANQNRFIGALIVIPIILKYIPIEKLLGA